ncbi:hypothetical protein B0H11DRAFT_2055792 [Mycena galericulata]|nr:hypothetical protein B0H11DRAFT_2055792 [Mycena galericulata]
MAASYPKWPGTNIHNVSASWEKEKDVLTQIITDIRTALVTLKLEQVFTPDIAAFSLHVSVPSEDLKHSLAIHYRSDTNKNTIYILPFLNRVEFLLRSDDLSPAEHRELGLDVIAISTAKMIIHETRHLIRSLLHGTAHCIPQGQSDDWFELSRYGAYATPALVCPKEPSDPCTTIVALTGFIADDPILRSLGAPLVKKLARKVRDGTFIKCGRFFIEDHTRRERGYSLELDTLFRGSARSRLPLLTHSPSRHSISTTGSGALTDNEEFVPV